jgi:hypothetical protein
MSNACWINDEDLAECTSVACGLAKELAFYVIDDNAVLPGEELAGCE